MFAKLKHFLRKDQPRTRDDLWKNIGLILKRFEPEECANYLANSGYGVLQTKRKTLLGPQPYLGDMLVFMQVSSMKTSLRGFARP